jgi:hypothetical protein
MTPDQTRDVLLMLSGMYPNMAGKVTKETIKGYALMLADIPQELLMDRMPAILSRHPTFVPTAPELRNAVLEQASALPDSAAAWEQVMRQIKERGMWYGPDPDSDPMLLRAIAAIGWEQLCCCEVDKLGVERAHFMRIYEAMRKTELEQASYAGLGAGERNKEIA